MPSKTDKAFIDNLQNFTNSLENIVDLLKEEQSKGDAINQMLSNMDGEKIASISENIKEILDVSHSIDDRTKEILNEVKAAKKEKESGMFGEIESKSNKEKVTGGIKTVMLIAVGVLAIGMAFKMVGAVDVLSVISLSIGIFIVAKAFSEMSGMKNLTFGKVMMTGLIVVLMATAITVSTYILQYMRPLGKDIVDQIGVVALGLSVGAIGISYIIKALGDKPDVGKMLMATAILPLIAGGIVASSYAFSYFNPLVVSPLDLLVGSFVMGLSILAFVPAVMLLGKLDYKQLITGVLGTAAIAGGIIGASYIFTQFKPMEVNPIDLLIASFAMGISMLAFVPAVMLLGKMGIKDMSTGILGALIIAGGIVGASYLFNQFQPMEVNPIDLLLSSIVMGLSMLAFVPAVMLLGKLSVKDLATGALGTVLISGAILASSWILSYGKYTDGPTVEWALGAGLALIAFTPAVMALGILAMTGIGALAIVAGAGLTLLVSASIVGSSQILKDGTYDNHPDVAWSLGTGLALLAFGTSMALLGVIPFGGTILENGMERVNIIAKGIVKASETLAGGKFEGGPTAKWAKGVGLSLSAFAYALSVSTETSLFSKKIDTDAFGEFMKSVAVSMIVVSNILGDHDWSGKYPTEEWGTGVARSLTPFIDAYAAMNKKKSLLGSLFGGKDDSFTVLMTGIADAMVKVSKKLADGTWSGAPSKKWSKDVSGALNAFVSGLGKLDEDKVDLIDDFSDAITNLARSVEKLNMSGIDKLNNLTSSITIMSAVDETNLNKVLGVLDNNKKQLSNVIDGSDNVNNTPSKKQKTSQLTSNISKNKIIGITPEQEMNQKFDLVLEKFDTVLEFLTQSKSGENVNKEDSVK